MTNIFIWSFNGGQLYIYLWVFYTNRARETKNNIIFNVKIVRMIYYIFGYYISGWDYPTENVITENVIHSTKIV